MNREQYLQKLQTVSSLTLNCSVLSEFNKALTELYLNGNNTFNKDLVLRIVQDFYFSTEGKSMEILEMVLDFIEGKTETEYKPTFSDNFKYWAIDSDGVAYYYEEEPTLAVTKGFWCTGSSNGTYQYDYDFDKDKYDFMWKNGNHINSLKEA